MENRDNQPIQPQQPASDPMQPIQPQQPATDPMAQPSVDSSVDQQQSYAPASPYQQTYGGAAGSYGQTWQQHESAQPASEPAQPAQPAQPTQLAGESVAWSSQPVSPQQPYSPSAGAPFDAAGFSSAQSYDPSMPAAAPMGYQPPAVQATGGTASLVCGIAAIVLSLLILSAPLGVILGIAAIILSRRKTSGKAKTGKICGIIGLIMSALASLLLALLVMGASVLYDELGVTSIDDIAGLSTTEPDRYGILDGLGDYDSDYDYDRQKEFTGEEKAVESVVAARFEAIEEGDPEALAEVADLLEESFLDNTGVTLEECGIDPMDYARSFTQGLTAYVDAIYVDGDEADVFIDIDSKYVYDIWRDFEDEASDFSESSEARGMTESEALIRAGEIFMDVVDSAEVEEGSFYLLIEMDKNASGEWVFDRETWEFEFNRIFGVI